MPEPILSIKDLTVEFDTEDGVVHAVTGVSYDVGKGEVVGVSNPHPHCQIYATNFVFKTIETEAAAGRRARTGSEWP